MQRFSGPRRRAVFHIIVLIVTGLVAAGLLAGCVSPPAGEAGAVEETPGIPETETPETLPAGEPAGAPAAATDETLTAEDPAVNGEDLSLPAALRGDFPGGLVLTFDDYSETWENYLPLMKLYGGRVTFYPSLAEPSPGEFALLAALERGGHEIGWHTAHHLDIRSVPSRKRKQFQKQEMERPVKELNGYLARPVTTLAYPFGFYDADWEQRLSGEFRQLRGFGRKLNVYTREELADRLFVKAASVDNIFYPTLEEFRGFAEPLLRDLAATRRIAVLGSHSFDGADWGIRPEHLAWLLEAARREGLVFLRMGDLLTPEEPEEG